MARMSSVKKSSDRKRKHDGEQANGISAKASKKRRRNKEKHHGDADTQVATKGSPTQTMTVSKRVGGDNSTWTVSQSIGGKFIDCDPLFTPDEKFVIFATESAVNIYSTADSSLVHALRAPDFAIISSYTLSAVDSNILWVGTLQGQVLKWDLNTGKLLGSWDQDGSIRSIVASVNPLHPQEHELLFSIAKTSEKKWLVTMYRVESEDKSHSALKAATLLNAGKPLSGLKLTHKGRYIIVISTDSIMVGELPRKPGSKTGRLRYTWREIICQEGPVCFDVRAHSKLPLSGSSKKPAVLDIAHDTAIDVIVGGVKGCIFAFDDLLNSLEHLENPSIDVQSSSALRGRSMHWHREAVGAVAWSKDGNYIVSGGRETVLVLWQLKTGSKQFLPNLESPIHSIVVSPKGSSYAVRLGDNSVMVLSTSELTPKAYVANLQTTSFSNVIRPEPEILTVEKTQKPSSRRINRVPAVLHPQDPNRILAAVPGYQNARGDAVGDIRHCYLQHFDLGSCRHEARQAISRTNAISSNLGPEGNRILEPEVNFVQVSCDGSWLATVDEWIMPAQDVKKLSASGDSIEGYRESRLRFWSWDSNGTAWTLNTRIEDPHHLEGVANSGAVLQVAASPTERRFATVGTDATLRIWTSKSKMVPARLAAGDDGTSGNNKSITVDQETWWTVQHTIPLESSMSTDPLLTISPSDAHVTYSPDGSVLAVYLGHDHDENENAIYFIDAHQGILREVKREVGLGEPKIYGLKFLDRYLICLGLAAVTIWDVTTLGLHKTIYLPARSSNKALTKKVNGNEQQPQLETRHDQIPIPHLEVDHPSFTFAVAIPVKTKRKYHTEGTNSLLGYQTNLLIFSPDKDQEALLDVKLPRLTAALLGTSHGKMRSKGQSLGGPGRGYVVLDIGAEARIITPGAPMQELSNNVTMDPLADDDGEEVAVNGLVNGISALSSTEEPADQNMGQLMELDEYLNQGTGGMVEEDSRPVVRKEELASVFDHPTHSMPPAQELFWGVLKLYAEKPVYDSAVQANMELEGQRELAEERFDAEQSGDSSESSSGSDSSSDDGDDE